MAIYQPPDDWFKAPTGSERTWVGIALAWCIVMSVMMPYWHFKGKQNSSGEAYKVEPMAYATRVMEFIAANQVGTDEATMRPIVAPAPGSDVYLQAQMWQYTPIIKLKLGQEYRLHLSSLDLQHGFSLQPLNMNFQILPGWDHVLTITPTSTGTFPIICNEFCGIGHHGMTGQIIVEE
ncbi:MAG: cytochrome C oxidase subunit II [Deltaproteobacteria bacterium]|nr:cytochrome C oxidase subunit II [Deltaproteobacteria bacterium]